MDRGLLSAHRRSHASLPKMLLLLLLILLFIIPPFLLIFFLLSLLLLLLLLLLGLASGGRTSLSLTVYAALAVSRG
jgi:hypothetical protein